MAKETVKEMATVSKELSEWFKAQSIKTGAPKTALIAMAMHEYKIKQESENNE